MTRSEVWAAFCDKTVTDIQMLQKEIQEKRDEIDQRIYNLYKYGMKVTDIVDLTNYSQSSIYRAIRARKEEKNERNIRQR